MRKLTLLTQTSQEHYEETQTDLHVNEHKA